MITATIIADSVSPAGKRITSFLVRYPRFIHSELMTHRMFSRNAASSRAIPVKKMIERLRAEPAMPVYWGSSKPGMQAGQEIPPGDIDVAKADIIDGMEKMISLSEKLLALNLHKQIANRYLEPWAHMETLVTATEWENFYSLRADPDAQPEFQTVAFAMLIEYLKHQPERVLPKGWHIPYGDRLPESMPFSTKLKIATARAARTSYMNFDGVSDHVKDEKMHDDLEKSGHWSPFEHCAQACDDPNTRVGNFVGWYQYRHTFRNENRHVNDYNALLTKMPLFVQKALGIKQTTT
jgi:thymidylate synthase ThyX